MANFERLGQRLDKMILGQAGLPLANFAGRAKIPQPTLQSLVRKGCEPTITTLIKAVATIKTLGYVEIDLLDLLRVAYRDDAHMIEAIDQIQQPLPPPGKVNPLGLARWREMTKLLHQEKWGRNSYRRILPVTPDRLREFIGSTKFADESVAPPTLEELRAISALGPYMVGRKYLSFADLVRLVYGDGQTPYDRAHETVADSEPTTADPL